MPRPVQTHCKRGHPFDEENTYVAPGTGWRMCRACLRLGETRRRPGRAAYDLPAMPTEPTVLAYAAGIIDGEGSIGIRLFSNGRTERRYHALVVKVSNTDPVLIAWLADQFGGSTYWRQPRYKHDRSPIYSWTAQTGTAEAFLRAIRPYLLMKAEQADIALELRQTKLRTGTGAAGQVTDAIHARREELRQQVMALNHRRRTPPISA